MNLPISVEGEEHEPRLACHTADLPHGWGLKSGNGDCNSSSWANSTDIETGDRDGLLIVAFVRLIKELASS